MKYLYLTTSILVITVAHLVRVMRWSYFIKIYEKPKYNILIKSLSVGYFINTFIPYKIGDIFRAAYSGSKHNNGVSLGFSSVIIERYVDVLTMGIIFIFLYYIKSDALIINTGIFYIFAFLSLIILTLIIYIFRRIFKSLIIKFASIFNSKIETSILVFAWTFILNFVDTIKKVNKIKLLITTVIMWALYFISYFTYATYLKSTGIKSSLIDILLNLFTTDGVKNSNIVLGNISTYINLLYFICPLIILFLIGCILKGDSNKNSKYKDSVKILPYIDNEDKLRFLENYFNNKKVANIKGTSIKSSFY